MSNADFRSVIDALSAAGATRPGRAAPVHRVAVLGAGAVGQLVACQALAAGLDVRLHSVYGDELSPLRATGVTVRGATLVGTYPVADPAPSRPAITVTNSLDEAVHGADVICIATPSAGHRTYASLLAPLLTDEQIVVLIPGRFLGTLAFRHELSLHHCGAAVTLAELCAAPYLVDSDGSSLVVHAVAQRVEFATLPVDVAAQTAGRLTDLLPMLTPADSPLVTGFATITGIVSAAPLLVNARVLDTKDGEGILLKDLISPSLSTTLLRQLDAERLEVGYRYGVRDLLSTPAWLQRAYGPEPDTADIDPSGEDLTQTLAALEAFDQVSVAGAGGPHLTDDVPNTLAPLALLARLAGVPTPATDTVVALASCLLGSDQGTGGRSPEELGLMDVRPQEAYRHLARLGAQGAPAVKWWSV